MRALVLVVALIALLPALSARGQGLSWREEIESPVLDPERELQVLGACAAEGPDAAARVRNLGRSGSWILRRRAVRLAAWLGAERFDALVLGELRLQDDPSWVVRRESWRCARGLALTQLRAASALRAESHPVVRAALWEAHAAAAEPFRLLSSEMKALERDAGAEEPELRRAAARVVLAATPGDGLSALRRRLLADARDVDLARLFLASLLEPLDGVRAAPEEGPISAPGLAAIEAHRRAGRGADWARRARELLFEHERAMGDDLAALWCREIAREMDTAALLEGGSVRPALRRLEALTDGAGLPWSEAAFRYRLLRRARGGRIDGRLVLAEVAARVKTAPGPATEREALVRELDGLSREDEALDLAAAALALRVDLAPVPPARELLALAAKRSDRLRLVAFEALARRSPVTTEELVVLAFRWSRRGPGRAAFQVLLDARERPVVLRAAIERIEEAAEPSAAFAWWLEAAGIAELAELAGKEELAAGRAAALSRRRIELGDPSALEALVVAARAGTASAADLMALSGLREARLTSLLDAESPLLAEEPRLVPVVLAWRRAGGGTGAAEDFVRALARRLQLGSDEEVVLRSVVQELASALGDADCDACLASLHALAWARPQQAHALWERLARRAGSETRRRAWARLPRPLLADGRDPERRRRDLVVSASLDLAGAREAIDAEIEASGRDPGAFERVFRDLLVAPPALRTRWALLAEAALLEADPAPAEEALRTELLAWVRGVGAAAPGEVFDRIWVEHHENLPLALRGTRLNPLRLAAWARAQARRGPGKPPATALVIAAARLPEAVFDEASLPFLMTISRQVLEWGLRRPEPELADAPRCALAIIDIGLRRDALALLEDRPGVLPDPSLRRLLAPGRRRFHRWLHAERHRNHPEAPAALFLRDTVAVADPESGALLFRHRARRRGARALVGLLDPVCAGRAPETAALALRDDVSGGDDVAAFAARVTKALRAAGEDAGHALAVRLEHSAPAEARALWARAGEAERRTIASREPSWLAARLESVPAEDGER